ncbi:M1 family aminopeptidase [Fibrobacterota bacterium]
MSGNSKTALFVIVPFLIICCTRNPVRQEADYSFRYTLAIPSLALDSLHVTLEITDWEHGDSVRLIAPPIYADNPLAEETGQNFRNLLVTGASGTPLEYAGDSVKVGWRNCFSLAFAKSGLPAVIEYDVRFLYSDSANEPRPHFNGAGGYLQGNYVFVIPCHHTETVDIWRDNYDIYVRYQLGSGITLYGDPQPEAFFRSAYELMFSTSALGGQVLAQGGGGGQEFRIVTVLADDTTAGLLLDTAVACFSVLLEDIAPVFGIIEQAPVSVILGVNRQGGLEGMYAFSTVAIGNNMVLAHEMVHSWIGLRVGEYDDPWWKEGTSNYLGFLIPLRNGLITQEYLDTNLVVDLSGDTNVMAYSLSDEYVRDNLFRPGGPRNWLYQLVYTKGAQACMLMDLRVREASGNTLTLDRLLGEFVKLFDGSAFHRQEYLDFLQGRSGADVSDIFSAYIDMAGVIPDSVLLEAHTGLRDLGAFGAAAAAKKPARDITKLHVPAAGAVWWKY